MIWNIKYVKEAKSDLRKLDKSMAKQVLAGIAKVSKNPLPNPHGYGKPLGNKKGNNLTGFFKIKYQGIGIRVVYTLAKEDKVMNILVVSKRDDAYCYKEASRLYAKYGDAIFKDIDLLDDL